MTGIFARPNTYLLTMNLIRALDFGWIESVYIGTSTKLSNTAKLSARRPRRDLRGPREPQTTSSRNMVSFFETPFSPLTSATLEFNIQPSAHGVILFALWVAIEVKGDQT